MESSTRFSAKKSATQAAKAAEATTEVASSTKMPAKATAEPVDFPRGGGDLSTGRSAASTATNGAFPVATSIEIKKVHRLAEIDAASAAAASQAAPHKKRQKKTHAKDPFLFDDARLDFIAPTPSKVECLSFKRLTVGMLLLGIVKEISDLDMTIALPNHLIAYVPISNISQHFSQILTKMQEETSNEAEENAEEDAFFAIPKIADFFQIGQLIVCAITKLEESKSGHNRIEASVKPCVVNDHLLTSALKTGCIFAAEIVSIEDKGFLCQAFEEERVEKRIFLKKNASADTLTIGSIFVAQVESVAARVIAIKQAANAFCSPAEANFGSLFPGMSFEETTVACVFRAGTQLNFGEGLLGTVDAFNVDVRKDETQKQQETLVKGQNVKGARLLWFDPAAKSAGFSLVARICTTPFGGFIATMPTESQRRNGAIVDAVVFRVDESMGVLMRIASNEDAFGYVHLARLSDTKTERVDSALFAVGSTHKARIVDFDPFNGLLHLSTQPSVLSQSLFVYEDVCVGSVVRGTIAKIEAWGAIVRLSDSVRGICPNSYAADVHAAKPMAKYSVGQCVRARVINVDVAARRLVLSTKKTLLAPNVAMFASIAEARIGSVASGVVMAVKDYGAVVLFLNGVRGLVPTRELSWTPIGHASECVFVGKTLKVKVIKNDGVNILLSGRVDPPSIKIPAAAGTEDVNSTRGCLKKGDVLTAKIVSIVPATGLCVTFARSIANSKRVFIGRVFLTDICDVYEAHPLQNFYVGQKVSVVVVNDEGVDLSAKNPKIQFSMRKSHFAVAAGDDAASLEEGASPEITSLSQLKTDDVVVGFVTKISDGGVFVHVGREVCGRVMIRELSTDFVKDWKSLYALGDLVHCVVQAVDPSKKQLDLSIKAYLVRFGEREVVFEDLTVGATIVGKIQNIQSYGLFIKISNSKISGLAHISNVADDPTRSLNLADIYAVGDEVTAKIIAIDEQTKKIQFGLKACFFADDGEDAQGATSQPDLMRDDDDEDDNEEYHSAEEIPVAVANEATGFTWRTTDEASEDEEAAADDYDLSDDDDEENENGSVAAKNKRLSKRQRDLRESLILAEEQSLFNSINSSDGPQTADEFQLACLANPNDAVLYIRFMNFYIQQRNYDMARSVAKTALSRIAFRQEAAKMHVWLAFLSLENLYGTAESLEETLIKARQCNDEKKLLIAFSRVLYSSGDRVKAEAIYSLLVKRFFKSFKCWKLKALFYWLTGDCTKARTCQTIAFKSLPPHKHIKAHVQFALLENKYGAPEISRTAFESILASHPKRLDIWLTYIQAESSAMHAYKICERCVHMKWSVKKKKFVFKLWLSIAKQLSGAADSSYVAAVKAAAKNYVESLNAPTV